MGNKSVDYTLRRYGRHWNVASAADDPEVVISQLCGLVRHWAVGAISYLMSIQGKPDLPNVFACTAAILRLKNSFRAAVICIKNGMHIEAITMSRLILEQIAWISAIYRLTEDLDEYTKLTPQSCITSLKKILPSAGALYGRLSETSHLHFETTLTYIKFHGDELAVRLHDFELCAADAILLLQLVDWLEIVGEHVYGEIIFEPRSTVLRPDGIRIAKPDRQILAAIAQAESYVESITRDA